MKHRYFRLSLSPGEKGEFLFPSLRIVRLVCGHCRWKLGDMTVSLSQGDLVFLNNLTPRSIVESENLILDVFEWIPTQLQGYPSLLGAFYRGNASTLPHQTDSLIDQTFDLLTTAHTQQADSAFITQLASAALCLLEIHMSCLGYSQPSAIAFRAASYIWQHFTEDLTIPAVAKQLNVSKNHLETNFKQVHGVGVGAYVRLIRLHHVQQLLAQEPERSVLDIAFSCGFKSSAGFYKAYKAVNGSAPKNRNRINE